MRACLVAGAMGLAPCVHDEGIVDTAAAALRHQSRVRALADGGQRICLGLSHAYTRMIEIVFHDSN